MKVQEVQRWKQVAHRRDVCITCRRHHENGGGLLLARAQGKEAGLPGALLDSAGYALMMHTFPPAWPESPGRAHGGITRRGPEGGASETAEHYVRRGDTDMSLRGGKRAV